jgi:hypothetical protein
VSRKTKQNRDAPSSPLDTAEPGEKEAAPAEPTVFRPDWRALFLCLLALTLPLGHWEKVVTPLQLHHVSLMFLLFLTGRYWTKYQRITTPFELWFPALLLCLLTLLPASPLPFSQGVMAAALFILVYHLVDRNALLWRVLRYALLGNSLAILLNLAARLHWIYPTFVDSSSNLLLAGQTRPEQCFSSLILLIVVPLALESARRSGRYQSGALITFLERSVVLLVPLFLFYPEPLSFAGQEPGGTLFLGSQLPLTLVALWLLSRIASKLYVARSHLPSALAMQLCGLVLLVAAFFLLTELVPDNALLLVLALLAAAAKPRLQLDQKVGHRISVLLIPVACLFLLKLLIIGHDDPRNYEYHVLQGLQKKELAGLREQLDFVRSRCPGERRADYYEARLLLAVDELEGARKAFQRALQPGANKLLSPPGEVEIQEFLEELRDRSSALPESLRGIAYEQALLDAGRERHALSLLEIRGDMECDKPMNPRPLATALAQLMERSDLETLFSEWDGALLAGILKSLHPFNELRHAPPEFPQGALPLVVVASTSTRWLECTLYPPLRQDGALHRVTEDPGVLFQNDSFPDFWEDLFQDERGEWLLPFSDHLVVHPLAEEAFSFSQRFFPLDPATMGMHQVVVYVPAPGDQP